MDDYYHLEKREDQVRYKQNGPPAATTRTTEEAAAEEIAGHAQEKCVGAAAPSRNPRPPLGRLPQPWPCRFRTSCRRTWGSLEDEAEEEEEEEEGEGMRRKIGRRKREGQCVLHFRLSRSCAGPKDLGREGEWVEKGEG